MTYVTTFRMPGETIDHLPWYVDSPEAVPEGATNVHTYPTDWSGLEAAPYSDEAYREVLACRMGS